MKKLLTGKDARMLRDLVERALMHKPEPRPGERYAAVDWAAGGDETVLAERHGNMLRILWRDRERDTVKAAQRVVAECRLRGIDEGQCWGDVCGLGVGIMQAAKHYQDFYFREFNGGQQVEDDHYVNLNIQAWHYFRQSLERGEICFPDGLEEDTVDQLCNRYLEWNDRGKLKCESKQDMKDRGLPSPDRADALVMAWWSGRFMAYADDPPPARRSTAAGGRGSGFLV